MLVTLYPRRTRGRERYLRHGVRVWPASPA